jgi:hypothetical protein
LIETFSNELSWEPLFEIFFWGTEGIMALREGHRPTLEPAIEHLWNSFKNTLSFLWWDCDVINVFSM